MKKMIILIFFILSIQILCRTKEEWKSLSIYQILLDRFATTSNTGECNNLYEYCGRELSRINPKIILHKKYGF